MTKTKTFVYFCVLRFVPMAQSVDLIAPKWRSESSGHSTALQFTGRVAIAAGDCSAMGPISLGAGANYPTTMCHVCATCAKRRSCFARFASQLSAHLTTVVILQAFNRIAMNKIFSWVKWCSKISIGCFHVCGLGFL